MGSKSDMATILPVEFGHERFVWVTDEQDGRVEGLNLLLAALVGLDADGPAAAPVIPFAFEPWNRTEKCATFPPHKPLQRANLD